MKMKRITQKGNMTIGRLAIESSTDAQTIRYYERLGLLPRPMRTESNYRVYDEGAITRLMFIRRAKEIGFSLNDIKVLLDMSDGKQRRCSDVRAFAASRLAKIRVQIADLHAMEKTLSNLVDQCARSDRITKCPILETLSQKS